MDVLYGYTKTGFGGTVQWGIFEEVDLNVEFSVIGNNLQHIRVKIAQNRFNTPLQLYGSYGDLLGLFPWVKFQV